MNSNDPKKLYVLPERILDQLEELCGQLQSIYLDIYSNHEVDVTGHIRETPKHECLPLQGDSKPSF